MEEKLVRFYFVEVVGERVIQELEQRAKQESLLFHLASLGNNTIEVAVRPDQADLVRDTSKRVATEMEEEYVRSPDTCPFCGSHNFVEENDDGMITRKCNDCTMSWAEAHEVIVKIYPILEEIYDK